MFFALFSLGVSHPFLGPARQGLTFFPLFSVLCVAMATNTRTVVFRLGAFPAGSSRDDVAQAVYDQFSSAHSIQSIQVLPGGICKVMFESPDSKKSIVAQATCVIGGVECEVLNHALRSSLVQVHYFPAEEDVALLSAELRFYGEIVNVRSQHWVGLPHVTTGTRLFEMKLARDIPRTLQLGRHRLKIWYRGQPLECDICKGSHKAVDCEFRNKCRLCKSEGHFAKDCPNPWGVASDPAPAPAPAPAPTSAPAPDPAPAPVSTPASASAVVFALAPPSGVSGPDSSSQLASVEGMDISDIRDNQLDELDSQVSPPRAPSAVEEVIDDNSQSILPVNANDLHTTVNESEQMNNVIKDSANVVNDISVTSKVVCSVSDRNKIAGKVSSNNSRSSGRNASTGKESTSTGKSKTKSMNKNKESTDNVSSNNSVGALEPGEICDVDMATQLGASKRALSDDSSELDSVDSCPVTPVAPQRKKPAVAVSPGYQRGLDRGRPPVVVAHAGKHSMPHVAKGVPRNLRK